MLYQLPTGKTRPLTIEQYLAMKDEDFEALIAADAGYHVENPFYDSALEDETLDEFSLPEDIAELPEELDEDE